MPIRRALARSLLQLVVRPGLAPGKSLARRRRAMERSARLLPLPLPAGVRRLSAAPDHPGEWWLPAGTRPDTPRGAVLYLHGGGFVVGSPLTHCAAAARLARFAGLPVLVLDYRLAPEHPFPAALDDARAAWSRLTAGAARPVSVAADSAGGWLAVALALQCAAAGLQRPAGLALFSPLFDLAAAEARGAQGDRMLPPGFLGESMRAWRGALPADDPRLDLRAGGLAGLPPLFASFDRDELLADDARQLLREARAAGVTARDEEATGLWHAWPLFAGILPEADATLRRAAAMLAPAGRKPD